MASTPDITLVINTFNRPRELARTIEALRRQRGIERWTTEILVVDDGSSTSAAAALRQAGLSDSVELIERPHRGAGAARNAGVERARGRWLLFLGDDIVAGPDLVASHAAFLAEAEARQAKRISLGYCRWAPRRGSKPFRELARAHHYDGLEAAQELDFRYFYTANIALPRQALEEAGPFDESVRIYWEDTEMGYRLERAGWRLIYNPAASAEHVHPPTSVADIIRRQEMIGFGGCWFYAKHPTTEVERVVFWPGTRDATPGPAWRRRLGCVAAEALERIAPNSNLLERLYARLFFSARCKGVTEGRKAFPKAAI
ncbi:MAG: glycosyltransferase family 2 protein [Candidatus Sumerlaeota bacterium]|nr:glycosyltransferase family 2 protein [Candidatus Sumerlaeota bacterium]